MKTGNGTNIRKINRSLILEKVIEHQSISRADLSKLTGLNKATISDQVLTLLEEKLLFESSATHHAVGRRPILLSINQNAGYVLGIDFNYKNVHFIISDLLGNVKESQTITIETVNYHDIVSLMQEQIKRYQVAYDESPYGLVHCIIGVHGTVDKNEIINFIPKYQWSNASFKQDLQKGLDIPLTLENNANLSAFAEKVLLHYQTSHLLAINFSSGIGSGNMIDWEFNKGYHGYAGEIGHMIITPTGPKCRCGNNGCWELYAAEPVFLRELSKQLEKTDMTHDDVQSLIKNKNSVALKLLDEYIYYVAIGLNNVINLSNPGTIVLNSRILQTHPNSLQIIKENLHSSVSNYENIFLSDLGDQAGVFGACFLGIQKFFDVSQLLLLPYHEKYFQS